RSLDVLLSYRWSQAVRSRAHSAGRASDGSPLTPDPYASAYVASWQGLRCASTITIRSRLRRRSLTFCTMVAKSGAAPRPTLLRHRTCERPLLRLPSELGPHRGAFASRVGSRSAEGGQVAGGSGTGGSEVGGGPVVPRTRSSTGNTASSATGAPVSISSISAAAAAPCSA